MLSPHVRAAGEVDDLPDQLLALVVVRVRLAGKDDLHGPFRVLRICLSRSRSRSSSVARLYVANRRAKSDRQMPRDLSTSSATSTSASEPPRCFSCRASRVRA